jgi:hypothetical protein
VDPHTSLRGLMQPNPNPNPNPNPKQFYEDVMQHGHPHSYDDAILESGNRSAKRGKRILFWGGSNELDPTIDR